MWSNLNTIITVSLVAFRLSTPLHRVDTAISNSDSRVLHITTSPEPAGAGARQDMARVSLVFENDRNCRLARGHIERNRVRLRTEKLRYIAVVLGSDITDNR